MEVEARSSRQRRQRHEEDIEAYNGLFPHWCKFKISHKIYWFSSWVIFHCNRKWGCWIILKGCHSPCSIHGRKKPNYQQQHCKINANFQRWILASLHFHQIQRSRPLKVVIFASKYSTWGKLKRDKIINSYVGAPNSLVLWHYLQLWSTYSSYQRNDRHRNIIMMFAAIFLRYI